MWTALNSHLRGLFGTRALAILAIIAATQLYVAQAGAATFWIGQTVFNTTTGCTSGWNPQGGVFQTILAPAGLPNNGLHSRFNIFDKTWAAGFVRANGRFDGVARAVTVTVVGNGVGSYTGGTVKFTKQSPATISATTAFVTVTGVITRFDGNAGCTVFFSSSLTRSPFE